MTGEAIDLATEKRIRESVVCSEWTPRDALVDAIRMIDKGEISPKALVIAWTEDEKVAMYSHASPSTAESVVALESAKIKMLGF